MNHISFGSVLKEARIRKGYELTTVARRLRIRPDILQAIEESNFENMPPRGYSRNMVNAYARFLGLNANDVTRMYLDEAYAHQISQAHKTATENRYLQRNTSHATTRATTSSSSSSVSDNRFKNQRQRYSEDGSSLNSLGRRMYSQDMPTTSGDPQQLHPSRRPVITEGKYTNLYTAPRSTHQNRSKLPFIVGGIVVIVIIIIVCVFAFGGKSQEQTTNIPVTGLETTEKKQTEQPVAVAPTEFVFSYQVAEGASSWVEVYIDDVVQEAGDVTGPHSQEYRSSSTIRFVSSATDGVSTTIDGVVQELSANSNGIITVTYTFDDILDAWYAAHPEVQRPASTTTTGSTTTTA